MSASTATWPCKYGGLHCCFTQPSSRQLSLTISSPGRYNFHKLQDNKAEAPQVILTAAK